MSALRTIFNKSFKEIFDITFMKSCQKIEFYFIFPKKFVKIYSKLMFLGHPLIFLFINILILKMINSNTLPCVIFLLS